MSSKTLDAAIDALVDALAELPEHELEGWQRGNRLGLRIVCELARAIPAWCRRRGRFGASRPERPARSARLVARRPSLLLPPMFFLGQRAPPCNHRQPAR